MAISLKLLTSNTSTTETDTYTTASITPQAGPGRLILAFIVTSELAGVAQQGSISGCSLSWTSIGGVDDGEGNSMSRAWRATASAPTAGTIVFSSLMQSGVAEGAAWAIVEVAGVDTATNDGVVQAASNSSVVDTVTVTLSAFGSSLNGTICSVMGHNTSGTQAVNLTEDTGHTELIELDLALTTWSTAFAYQIQYNLGNDTSVVGTANAANDTMAAIALEIKALPDRLPTQRRQPIRQATPVRPVVPQSFSV